MLVELLTNGITKALARLYACMCQNVLTEGKIHRPKAEYTDRIVICPPVGHADVAEPLTGFTALPQQLPQLEQLQEAHSDRSTGEDSHASSRHLLLRLASSTPATSINMAQDHQTLLAEAHRRHVEAMQRASARAAAAERLAKTMKGATTKMWVRRRMLSGAIHHGEQPDISKGRVLSDRGIPDLLDGWRMLLVPL
jgi:hypothetical protein